MDAEGGRLFVVGGGVRDHLMALPVKDWDVEVFGLPIDRLARVLTRTGSVNAVGRSFGVLKWRVADHPDEIDVSIPRRDSKVGPGHRGIQVEGDPTMTVEEAARRRDLTLNAMMWDPVRDELVDPFHGVRDLEAGRLRAVDPDTFLEDPLRALRVVQFVARTGFEADAELLELCRTASLGELPAERVQGEWLKLLLKGRWIGRGLSVARACGVLARVLPEAVGLDTDDLLDGLVAERGRCAPEGRRAALMLTGWLWPAGPAAAEATLDRLDLHSLRGYPTRDRTLAACAHLDAPIGSDAELRRLSTRAELELVLRVRGVRDRRPSEPHLARAEQLGILHDRPAPLLQGRHLQALGMKGGRPMGELLAAAYELQLDGLLASSEEALAWAAVRVPST